MPWAKKLSTSHHCHVGKSRFVYNSSFTDGHLFHPSVVNKLKSLSCVRQKLYSDVVKKFKKSPCIKPFSSLQGKNLRSHPCSIPSGEPKNGKQLQVAGKHKRALHMPTCTVDKGNRTKISVDPPGIPLKNRFSLLKVDVESMASPATDSITEVSVHTAARKKHSPVKEKTSTGRSNKACHSSVSGKVQTCPLIKKSDKTDKMSQSMSIPLRNGKNNLDSANTQLAQSKYDLALTTFAKRCTWPSSLGSACSAPLLLSCSRKKWR